MILTETARRMLDSLPDYYWGNPLIQRILQSRANEFDRMDAMIDTIKQRIIPAQGDDSLKMLSIWEAILGLPVAPGAVVAQRQTAVKIGLMRLDAVKSRDVLALLRLQLGTAFSVDRDTPAVLQDTITIGYAEGSFNAAVVERVALRAWPAHRHLFIHYSTGFILDTARLDHDTL